MYVLLALQRHAHLIECVNLLEWAARAHTVPRLLTSVWLCGCAVATYKKSAGLTVPAAHCFAELLNHTLSATPAGPSCLDQHRAGSQSSALATEGLPYEPQCMVFSGSPGVSTVSTLNALFSDALPHLCRVSVGSTRNPTLQALSCLCTRYALPTRFDSAAPTSDHGLARVRKDGRGGGRTCADSAAGQHWTVSRLYALQSEEPAGLLSAVPRSLSQRITALHCVPFLALMLHTPDTSCRSCEIPSHTPHYPIRSEAGQRNRSGDVMTCVDSAASTPARFWACRHGDGISARLAITLPVPAPHVIWSRHSCIPSGGPR